MDNKELSTFFLFKSFFARATENELVELYQLLESTNSDIDIEFEIGEAKNHIREARFWLDTALHKIKLHESK